MPDISSFEHHVLESEISALAQEVAAHREMPENSNLTEQELVKKSLETFTSPPRNSGAPVPDGASPLPNYAQNASPQVKLEIEYLLDLAFHEGIMKAAGEAAKAGPFVLDAFHDALAGRLYPELERRGVVKNR